MDFDTGTPENFNLTFIPLLFLSSLLMSRMHADVRLSSHLPLFASELF